MAPALTTENRLPLRALHLEATRRSVLDGLSRLLLNHRPDEISFAAIAEESKVSVRTVYRHFNSKEALFDAHWRHITMEMGADRVPQTTADLLALIPELFNGYHDRAGLIKAYLVPTHGREFQRANLAKIRKSLASIAQQENNSLDETEARWAAAILNSLFCVRGWVTLNEDFDMDGDEATRAIVWATNLVLEALKHGIHKT